MILTSITLLGFLVLEALLAETLIRCDSSTMDPLLSKLVCFPFLFSLLTTRSSWMDSTMDELNCRELNGL